MKPVDIIKLRKKLGLTQTELAAKLGVDRAAVNQWESGARKPSRMAEKFITLLVDLNEKGIQI